MSVIINLLSCVCDIHKGTKGFPLINPAIPLTENREDENKLHCVGIEPDREPSRAEDGSDHLPLGRREPCRHGNCHHTLVAIEPSLYDL